LPPSTRSARRRAGTPTGSRHGSVGSSCASARAPRPFGIRRAQKHRSRPSCADAEQRAWRSTASSTATTSCIQSSALGVSPVFRGRRGRCRSDRTGSID
jgi:hypothetical protein